MRKYTLFQVDAFTEDKFMGNPAGVVVAADGLSESEMQKIARELNNSETAFILSATSADHDVWLRYFTPTTEVPLCGHATIAAHHVLAQHKGSGTVSLLQKTGAGILPVEVVAVENGYEIVMTQGSLEFSQNLSAEQQSSIVAALGLTKTDRDERCPMQIVGAGHSKVIIGVKSSNCLNSLKPDYQKLSRVSREIGCNGYFIFTFDTHSGEILTNSRMFAPAIGINEDPVTGNGNGPLGAYLVYNELVQYPENGMFEFNGQQGEAIGRTGHVRVMVQIENGKPVRTKVAGRAVIVFQTEIELP